MVWIVDGDTVYVFDASNTQHKIRLVRIVAPKQGQPFERNSTRYLASLVGYKPVVVERDKRDRYGRIVGKILYKGRDVNLQQVEAGLARWYRKYAHEQLAAELVLYKEAEKEAKQDQRGLWRDPDPVLPWEWRRTR